ncbi:MAG: group 1 truncated hemoglobin [Myxococcales bacterium]
MTYFEDIGGEFALSAIIDDFVERVCADGMIGFLFARVNRDRLKRMEYEHAAEFLGAQVRYSGRDMREAHQRHPIMGGHFGRRRQILKTTLEKHRVPPQVIEAWLAHQDALRGEITGDRIDECVDARAATREPSQDARAATREPSQDARAATREPSQDARAATREPSQDPTKTEGNR